MKQHAEQIQRFTLLWIKAQPKAAAYIASVVRDRHHAEDLLQEVAITAIDKFEDYDTTRSFDAWVLGITRLKILRYFRTKGHDRLVLDEASLEKLQAEYEVLSESHDERLGLLHQCIETLTAKSKSILKRRYYGGMKVKDIATEVGQTSSSVSKQLFLIRQQLEACMDHRLHESEVD